MIIQCESCSRKFVVRDIDIPKKGRTVQCGYCSVTWHQMPLSTTAEISKKQSPSIPIIETEEGPSVDSIRASDGKTYKFLGSQWAELMSSGKTGLFARKKISQELDEITGRKTKKAPRKKHKKIEEVDPSDSIDAEKQLPDIYQPKQGLGFFGYIFLIIVIGFSLVGMLKTFEDELLNYYPEIEYIYNFLNEQLLYIAETVKNIIVIISDLINSY